MLYASGKYFLPVTALLILEQDLRKFVQGTCLQTSEAVMLPGLDNEVKR